MTPKQEFALKHLPPRSQLPRIQFALAARELASPAVEMGLARTDTRKENMARMFVSRAPLGVLSMVLNFMVNLLLEAGCYREDVS